MNTVSARRPWRTRAARVCSASRSRPAGVSGPASRSRDSSTVSRPRSFFTIAAQSSGHGHRLTAKQLLMPSLARISVRISGLLRPGQGQVAGVHARRTGRGGGGPARRPGRGGTPWRPLRRRLGRSPAPRPASIAVPAAVESPGTQTTGVPVTSALIWFHSAIRAPPPETRSSVAGVDARCRVSRRALTPKATPSRVARAHALRSCLSDRPDAVPRRVGSSRSPSPSTGANSRPSAPGGAAAAACSMRAKSSRRGAPVVEELSQPVQGLAGGVQADLGDVAVVVDGARVVGDVQVGERLGDDRVEAARAARHLAHRAGRGDPGADRARDAVPGAGDDGGVGFELQAAGQGGAQAADDAPGGFYRGQGFRVEVEAVDQFCGPGAFAQVEEGGGGGDGPVGAGLAGQGQAYVVRGLRPIASSL